MVVGKPACAFTAFLLPAALCMLFSSCIGGDAVTRQYIYPLEDEIDVLNTVTVPAETYAVKTGDTPIAVARKFGIDWKVLVDVNGIHDPTGWKPGTLLTIPRVESLPGEPGQRRPPRKIPDTPGDASSPVELISAYGVVKALSAGVVTEVLTGYTSLGDVVIIEGEAGRAVYSGSFKPLVAKGQSVAAGEAIATTDEPENVKARFFDRDH